MHYHIDKTAAQSAYLQLYHQLRRDIVSGVYPLGTKMPSKRLIATETGVSVITVEHALAILCDEGYLESRERSGFFVSFAAADCFPVSETETERRMTVSHGTEDEFPFPSLAKTMRRVLSEYGESILVKSPNNGCAELRGTIAAYLSRSRGISVQPGQIVIGSGAEYLYGLIVQLLGRERVFALEDPSYDKIRRVYQAHGVTCEMLRLGSDGIRSDELTRASATVLHVTPFHSFPSLVTASAGKRLEYLRWAEERGGYIVEDDFDSEFSVSSKSEDTLFALESERSVIYMNTFSKTIAPSMRVGYMVLPPALSEQFRREVGFYLESRERSGFFVSFAAADCFPVSETETERRMTVSHGTEDEFPFPSLAKTMRRVLSEYGESILVKSPNNGCAELRGTIAAYLSRSRGISVQPGQIVIGSGAEYLYGLIVQLLGRERVFALEDPSYDKIRRVYQAHGVTCEMLRLGSDGIRSDELTRASATVLHVTPFHSFPSLVTASAGKRLEYLRWAEERGGYIVEDDFDSEFSVSSKSEDTLFALESERSVIYMNTFSKTIAPSMRVGYMVLPPALSEQFRREVGFYSCTVPVFEQYVLAELIGSGDFERHINRIRRRRRKE